MDARLQDYQRRMQGAIEAFQRELSGLRTGRASANLLDPVMVEAYGAMMPITQVGTVQVVDARLISVQVWDASLVRNTEKAIRESGLGLNPAIDGQLIRVPLPDLTAERRQELAKVAGRYAEEARVGVRNVRRDAMDLLKKLEKDGEISEDEHHRLGDNVQKMTDEHVKRIDDLLTQKQKEITQV